MAGYTSSVVDCDMDVDIEIAFEGGKSDGAHPRISLFMNPLMLFFMWKKDLNPKSLRWYLLLQQFDFEVHNKG